MSEQFNPLALENQLCFPLYACARKVVGMYTPFFKPLGITYTQYIVFMVLWEQDGVSVHELGEKLYLDSGTLTPLLKKMESAGYVRRERSKDDERVTIIYLTDEGRAMREKCESIPLQLGKCMPMELEEAIQLRALLRKLLAADACSINLEEAK